MKKKLMVSTSGIRGVVGNGLDPIMLTGYAAAYGAFLQGATKTKKNKTVIIGRDSRVTGQMVKMSTIAALRSVGVDVVDIGIVPTPTVELAVIGLNADGGICITASHNPAEWNALKFFNSNGEFINKKDLEKIKKIHAGEKYGFKGYKDIGSLTSDNSWIDKHIASVLKLKAINQASVKKAKLKIVVDAVNSAGSFALPELLEKMGVEVIRLNCEGNGDFNHEPEPIPKNLGMLSAAVKKFKADCGMACDPDADRLALVDETGEPIGEELTLTLSVKYILSKYNGRKKPNVVINMSTSRVTDDVAVESGAKVYYTPVGEANVIEGMRKKKALIGGEGNGGVIYPDSHYGRDALVGGAIICSLLAKEKKSMSVLAGTLPKYYNIKMKAPVPAGFETRLAKMEKAALKSFENLKIDRRDGVRFDFPQGWFQIRKSNTEPIFRLIVETNNPKMSQIVKKEALSFFK